MRIERKNDDGRRVTMNDVLASMLDLAEKKEGARA